MALYPPAVKQLIPPPSNDPKIKARVVILHVAATNATSLHDYFNGPSGGVESHFYVLKDGTVQQYRDTAYQADANVMANDFAISIETQGLADGTWTDAQMTSIKALLLWCRDVHSIPLVKCPKWDGSGVGYHVLFEDQWDQRHASCPGPNRIAQFENVLVPWMASSGKEDAMSFDTDEETQIRANVRATPITLKDGTTDTLEARLAYVVSILAETQKRITAQSAQVTALSAAVQTLSQNQGIDPAAVKQAVQEALDAYSLTLTKEQA